MRCCLVQNVYKYVHVIASVRLTGSILPYTRYPEIYTLAQGSVSAGLPFFLLAFTFVNT